MSKHQTRRDVLKKMAATGVVGGSLIASSGTAAAAEADYEIEVGFKADNDGYSNYRIHIPYGDTDSFSVSGGTKNDQIYANDDTREIEIIGTLDADEGNTVDTWTVKDVGTGYYVEDKDSDVYVEDTL